MGFRVVEDTARTFWVSTDGSSTYYIGQLVTYMQASKAVAVGGTVAPLAVPAGAADTTNFQCIAGVVTGINAYPAPLSNSTGEYVTGVTTQATQLARDWRGNGGMYSPNDPQVLIQITEILPNTIVEGDIYNAAIGTAPTVLTSTATDTTGFTSAGTTNACEFTPVANTCTIYCRTGANMGLYRVTSDTSTTAPAVTVGFPYDVAIGDTFVRVSMKQGLSRIYINGPGLYIDNSLSGGSTNYFDVFCYKLKLDEAGKEVAQFRFANQHFDTTRA